jgi:outer membrane protein assembly factor BamB
VHYAAPRGENELSIRCNAARVFAIVSLVGCATTAPAPPRSYPAGAWTQFRLNGGNNVVLPGTLRAAWSVESGGPISASPSVAHGTLFVGNNAGRFLALDVRTGHELWHAVLRNALMSAPLVIGKEVIVGEGNENSEVHHGVVHVGSGSNALVALDRENGTERWRSPLTGTAMPTPAYVGGRILAHNGNGDLLAIEPEDGSVVFARNLGTIPSMVAVMPLGVDTIVTAGQTETQIVAARTTDGAIVWRSPFSKDSGLGDCPLASDGHLVFGDYLAPFPNEPFVRAGRTNEERAYALDARSGVPVWDVHLENGIVPTRNQAAIPLLDGSTLYVGSSIAPAVHALDAATGRVRWNRRVGGVVKGGLVASRGIVYFGDFSGRLWALRERDGSIVGVANVGTPFNVDSPIIIGETLVIGSATGRVLALPLAALAGSRDIAAPPASARRWFAPNVMTRFAAADRNRDGVLTRREFASSFAHGDFARFDRDGNGLVTPLEFGVAFVRSRGPHVDRVGLTAPAGVARRVRQTSE